MEIKQLYRSKENVKIWGIIGGIGEYFEIDPTILRLGFIILTIATGVFPCIIAYIIAHFIIPKRTATTKTDFNKNQTDQNPVFSPEKETVYKTDFIQDIEDIKTDKFVPEKE